MEDKKEIMFRVLWGLGHLTLLYLFVQGFLTRWNRFEAILYAEKIINPYGIVPPAVDPAEGLTYDHIFKRSLTAGFANIFSSIEKYPMFWALPTFFFFSIADFSSFAASPLLLYNLLAVFDTFRFLSYDFLYFEIVA